MDGRWIPEQYFAMSGWRNAFVNTPAVQLLHRAPAVRTLAAVGAGFDCAS